MESRINQEVANKYLIDSVLANGAYGAVYAGTNIRTNEPVAIKFGLTEYGGVKREAKLCKHFSGSQGFLAFKWFGVHAGDQYFVTNLLGIDIHSWLLHAQTPPPINHALSLGKQMFAIMYTLHEQLLVHRDIKPGNFVFSPNTPHTLNIIDLGFCARFADNDGRHTPIACINDIIGTPNFISTNVHDNITPSRRDDIISCIYVMLYMIYPHRLWFHIPNIDRVSQVKHACRVLDNDMGIDKRFFRMLDYAYGLEYEAPPDYSALQVMCGDSK
jgi:serine/threonine protein kinase